jgi:integrase
MGIDAGGKRASGHRHTGGRRGGHIAPDPDPAADLRIKTETATRVRGRIEKILDWAEHRSYRKGKNPARWEGNLVHELPSPPLLKKRKKRPHAALPYLEVGALLADLRTRQGITPLALEWGILTAARSQEIRGARRSEVNLQLRRWTIPARRMKMEKDHVAPLSQTALSLFERLPRGDNGLLFLAPEVGELSDAAFGALIDDMHVALVKRGVKATWIRSNTESPYNTGFGPRFETGRPRSLCSPATSSSMPSHTN